MARRNRFRSFMPNRPNIRILRINKRRKKGKDISFAGEKPWVLNFYTGCSLHSPALTVSPLNNSLSTRHTILLSSFQHYGVPISALISISFTFFLLTFLSSHAWCHICLPYFGGDTHTYDVICLNCASDSSVFKGKRNFYPHNEKVLTGQEKLGFVSCPPSSSFWATKTFFFPFALLRVLFLITPLWSLLLCTPYFLFTSA